MAALLITAVAGTGASTGHLSERESPRVGRTLQGDASSQVASQAQGAEADTSSGLIAAATDSSRASRSEKCHARKGLRFYVRRHNEWRSKMGAGRSVPAGLRVRRTSCPLYLAKVWRKRAWIARQTYEAWAALQAKRLRNPTYAICHVFGRYCSEALRVASCESGRGVYASNGQYLGMFQMGDYARDKYGHSSTALGQAKAAYAYFVDSGRDWSPWSCKP